MDQVPLTEPSTGLLAAIAGFIATALGLAAAGHALIHKRKPQSAFGWIAVCLSLPLVGPLLYYLFGINRVRTRARVLRRGSASPTAILREHPLAGAPLVGGNRIGVLHNGEQAFPAMLERIHQATERVLLSTYIFDTSDTGRRFVDALAAAHGRGAEVRVLIDGIGEMYSLPRVGGLLQRAGIRFARFLPPRLFPPTISVNLRNHRKILIADEAAFVGGINISGRHLAGDASTPHRVVDLHFELEGAIVPQLEQLFIHDWRFTTGEALQVRPSAQIARGEALCRTVAEGPDDDADPLTALLLRAIGTASKRIAIMTPYFLPPRTLMGALQSAALRGVDVAIILPIRNNLPYMHWATRHMLWELLQRQIRIYYQPAPFVHSKLLIVDDLCAIIGSWNFDARSLRLNFELAVEIYESSTVGELTRHFDRVRALSLPVGLHEVDSRPLPIRLRDGFAWLFSPYL